MTPALLTGFALAFARAVGEYYSVIFIAGNLPMVSEITPLIIITKLEAVRLCRRDRDAAVMLGAFRSSMLLAINLGLRRGPPGGADRRRSPDGRPPPRPSAPPRRRSARFEPQPATRERHWVAPLVLVALAFFGVFSPRRWRRLRRGAAQRGWTSIDALVEPDALRR